jgi:DNA-binding NtrC family response regulator
MGKESPILILSSNKERREWIANHVLALGLRPVCCERLSEARALASREPFSAALCDNLLPDGDLRAVIGEVSRSPNRFPVVILLPGSDWDFFLSTMGLGVYLSAMALGAAACVPFPPAAGELERILEMAVKEMQRHVLARQQRERRPLPDQATPRHAKATFSRAAGRISRVRDA